MSTQRMIRVNELLRREIGTALYRIVDETDCDMSAVTVTHVVTSSDLRAAQVFVSVRGDHDRQKRTLAMIRSHRVAIQEAINENVVLKYTPRLTFSLDTSLEEGDRVLSILRELGWEEPQDDAAV